MESSKQVWSAHEGYPGEYEYREFYRDVGFDLDYDYIRPYLHSDGNRINLGIKYYKITGPTDIKEPYQPSLAREKAAVHAGHFMFNREKQVEYLHDFLGIKPIIVSPYDAELFGHWWYEGPEWIEFLLRKIHFDQETLRPITPSEYLEMHPKLQLLTPSMSSWGWKGYSEVWLEGSNDWIYSHIHIMADRMVELAGHFSDARGILRRALNQAARELLLAQSSDWAFIMKTGTMADYARKRTKDHIARFDRLYHDIGTSRINEQWLKEIESRDNIFPDIDYRVFCG
jgi:1,4-alpha-glucan branching enzyme